MHVDDQFGRYLAKLADLPPLGAVREREDAVRIKDLEVAVWETLLFLPSRICDVLDAARAALPDVATDLPGNPRKRVRKNDRVRVKRLVSAIIPIDRDKRAVLAAVEMARDVARRSQGPRVWARNVAAAYREWERAQHDFVRVNLRLVVSIARKRWTSSVSMTVADIVQEGNLGLMKAVHRYDPQRGFRFSTYATWWIRHYIERSLQDKGQAIRIPVHIAETRRTLGRTAKALSKVLDRDPTEHELAAKAGIGIVRVRRIRTLLDKGLSLDAPMGGTDLTLADVLATGLPDIAESLASDDAGRHAVCALSVLSHRSRTVLRKRYGIGNDDPETLAKIGHSLGLSRERVRQIEEAALVLLRRQLSRESRPANVVTAEVPTLVGVSFGRLTVVEDSGSRCECVCACGKSISLTRSMVAQRRSCGCSRLKVKRRAPSGDKPKFKEGDVRGQLTVVRAIRSKTGSWRYRAVCTCGTRLVTNGSRVNDGMACVNCIKARRLRFRAEAAA